MWSPCYFYQDWYLTSSFAISCKFEWMLFLFCLFAVCFPLRTTIIKFYLLWICNIFLFSILRNSNIFLTSQHFFFVYWCRSLLEHWCRNNVPFWAWRGFCLRRWWWGNFFLLWHHAYTLVVDWLFSRSISFPCHTNSMFFCSGCIQPMARLLCCFKGGPRSW